MLSPLAWTIYLAVLTFRVIDARAVDTDLPTSDISSTLTESTVATASAQSCTDIKTCRTLDQIVVSCLVTILACVWFAVYRNIPAPENPLKDPSALLLKIAKRIWSVVLGQMDAVMVFAVALLAPEWILAWALRQAMVAWKLAGTLEKARLEAKARQKDVDFEKHTGDMVESVDGHSSMDGSVTTHTDSETGYLIKRRSDQSTIQSPCDKCEGRGCQCDRVASEKRVAKGDQCWDRSHGFLVAMGGFHFYNTDRPLYPLSPANVVELVRRGHLVPPTTAEISDKSKGDALSKGVAVAQTMWFVIQCIARRAAHLPVTSLVMTLAYTVMTVAMYAAWWAKPLNVSCAIRVPEEEVEEEEVVEYGSIGEKIVIYVMGGQDDFVDVRQCKRVPTFWAGKADSNDAYIADGIALLVAMAFGAVHCIAWFSEFQSPLERQLWRWSAITIIAVPAVLVVLLFVVAAISACLGMDNGANGYLAGALYTPVSIVYIAARLILILLSFKSLRGLPVAAYQTVQWTTLIPHI